MASVVGAQRGHALHQLGIAAREARGIEPDVVLQPGPAMSAELEAPAADLELVPSEAGGPPGGVGLQRGELRDEELQQRAAHRQGVADPKHELDVQGPTDRALDRKSTRLNSSHYCAS